MRRLAICLLLTLCCLALGCTRPPDGGTTAGGATGSSPGETSGGATSKGDPKAKDDYAEKAIDGDKIKIGVFTSMTGANSTFGKGTYAGMELAAEEVNAKGGVLGKKIELKLEDNESKSDKSVSAAQKLISQDNVLVLLGDVASTNSLAVAPICQEKSVPMISPSSTNVRVTQVGDMIFRVCFIDDFQGYVMARYAAENLKAKTAALMVDKGSDYSTGLAAAFQKTFEEKGGKIVANESFTAQDTDFSSILTKIKGTKPDVIFLPAYYNSAGLVASQARQQGIDVPILGGDGWESPELVRLGGESLEGCAFSTHFNVSSESGKVAEFAKKFKAKTGDLPDGLSALGYDDVMLVADAINRSGEVTGGKFNRWAIRDALAATRDFEGVTGKITINKDRNADKPATIMQIKNGQLEFVTQIAPE